jgi:DNA-binding CsgD family transcriptional regulator
VETAGSTWLGPLPATAGLHYPDRFSVTHRGYRLSTLVFSRGESPPTFSGYADHFRCAPPRSASSPLLVSYRKRTSSVPPLIAGELLQAYKEGGHRQFDTGRSLTSPRREVLQLLAGGYSTKEIAMILNISLKTVEHHKVQMVGDLGIKSLAELVLYAVKHSDAAP